MSASARCDVGNSQAASRRGFTVPECLIVSHGSHLGTMWNGAGGGAYPVTRFLSSFGISKSYGQHKSHSDKF